MAAQGAAWARSLLTRRSEPAAEHARVQRELDEDCAVGMPAAAQRLGGGGDAAGAAVATSSTRGEHEDDERARVMKFAQLFKFCDEGALKVAKRLTP